jgi:GT2 family glycosyltransferase
VTEFDIVTVVHNDRNAALGVELEQALKQHADMEYEFWTVDNRERNRGFGPGCLLGAGWGNAPIIGLLNPDLVVTGPFMRQVRETLRGPVVVTGERFGKKAAEYQKVWGCHDWVCGAAFFVLRDWWDEIGGFDPNFVWGWEETDFIRKTQAAGKRVQSIVMPSLHHASPQEDTPEDGAYKRKHFERGANLFYKRWGRRQKGYVIG